MSRPTTPTNANKFTSARRRLLFEEPKEPEPEKPQLRRSARIAAKNNKQPEPEPELQKQKQQPKKAKQKKQQEAPKINQPTKTEIDTFLEKEQQEYGRYGITREQLEFLLKEYFETKNIFGLGRDRIFQYLTQKHPEMKISRRQVNRFLQSLEVVQLFNPTKATKDIAKTITEAPFKRFELDLVDFQNMESQGYKYVMNMIDTFSKYVISRPIRDKEEKTVLLEFKNMIDELEDKFNKTPSSVLSDNGSEFINQGFKEYCKSKNITQIFTKKSNGAHAKLVERFNGYLRRQIAKYDNQFDDPEWSKYLQRLITNYNNTISRITKKSPISIMTGDTDNVKENIEKAIIPKNDKLTPYKKGDYVRIKTEMGSTFEKPTNNISWTREIYEITRVFMPKKASVLQPKYKIKPLDKNEEIPEFFYHNDLRVIDKDMLKKTTMPEKFVVQKIIKQKEVEENGIVRKKLLVKFKGIRQAEWQPYEVMKVDVPLLVKRFEERMSS